MKALGRVLGRKLHKGIEVISRTLSSFSTELVNNFESNMHLMGLVLFGEPQRVRLQPKSVLSEINNREAVYAPFNNTIHVTRLKYQQGS